VRPIEEPWLCRVIRKLADIIYPDMELVGELPQEPCVVVGNHCQTHGPIVTEVRLPFDHYTWCAWQMMDRHEVAEYALADFWPEKPRRVRWLYWIASRLIVLPASYIMTHARTIPVYRDTRCLTTFRRSMEKLGDGYSMVIFPECAQRYNNIIYDFQDRFIDLARMYYRKTGVRLCFVPMYLAPKLKKIFFGEPIRYDPEPPFPQERQRIKQALMDSITQMAVSQPLHTVIPYRNIAKKDYPKNLPCEVYSLEKDHG